MQHRRLVEATLSAMRKTGGCHLKCNEREEKRPQCREREAAAPGDERSGGLKAPQSERPSTAADDQQASQPTSQPA